MTGNPEVVFTALDRNYLHKHPLEAAAEIEGLTPTQAAGILVRHPARDYVTVWKLLAPSFAAAVLQELPRDRVTDLLNALSSNEALQLLGFLGSAAKEDLLNTLDATLRKELRELMAYPADTAGRLMDTHFHVFRNTMTAQETLKYLQKNRVNATRSLYLIDENKQICGKATIQHIAVAPPGTLLQDLAQPVLATVNPLTPLAEVVDILEKYKIADLPVLNVDGTILGMIYHSALIDAAQADAMANLQSMVGASREERALSSPFFAVRKRMPWLQINLLTAFLAAAVVGLFEGTIAKFTALAVLLPVVAGQSGNAGAQALAVTMRGLALREISIRNWPAVTTKEVIAGLLNGLAIAVTCGLGVYVWSGSFGLVLVIAMSMVLAMVMAGFAGALVPIVLTRLGQDPAQSSSIVLTTVTDVAGFFSFLGIATLLSSML